jgi:hypothetical protein
MDKQADYSTSDKNNTSKQLEIIINQGPLNIVTTLPKALRDSGRRTVGCLGDDDVARDVTIEEMSQAVFSASPLGALGGYITRPSKLNWVSAGSAV